MNYDDVRREAGKHKTITHTWLQTRFNLRYSVSRIVIDAMLVDGTLADKQEDDVSNTGYEVLRKMYEIDNKKALSNEGF
jgi:predicted transcriptional regulator